MNPPQKLTSGVLGWDADVLSVSNEFMEWFITRSPYKHCFSCVLKNRCFFFLFVVVFCFLN